jgi:adenine-specific DNA methylase
MSQNLTVSYPKRLIEVDLPIARISAHARREKSIRHGHISTLHIWWARRPLAACRAVICAALWPDPGDELCPREFKVAAIQGLTRFAKRVFPERINAEGKQLQETASAESLGRWESLAAATLMLDPDEPVDGPMLRYCLLDFIADFANWDNSTVAAYLETSRMLTAIAHASLSDPSFRLPKDEGGRMKDERGIPTSDSSFILPPSSFFAALPRPLVVDPFAGGGSIPLEALRVGADAFASDLNPVPVLLNKVVLEYIPKFGKAEVRSRNAEGKAVTFHGLADAVRYWGNWIKDQAERELAEFYPKDPDGATPIAYLWARTIRCEGPACGAEVPLIRSLWLAKKANRSVALRLIPNPREKRVDFDILVKHRDGWVSQSDLKSEISNLKSQISNPSFDRTVKRGSATCPCCGYTTPVASVRNQLKSRNGGTYDSRLFAIVNVRPDQVGRFYRVPTSDDLRVVERAK